MYIPNMVLFSDRETLRIFDFSISVKDFNKLAIVCGFFLFFIIATSYLGNFKFTHIEFMKNLKRNESNSIKRLAASTVLTKVGLFCIFYCGFALMNFLLTVDITFYICNGYELFREILYYFPRSYNSIAIYSSYSMARWLQWSK